MTTIFCAIGQGGNQINEEFWKIAQKENAATKEFCDQNGKAHCLLVDSEPKVIQAALRSPCGAMFRSNNIIYEQSGRGNNWAMGYHSNAGDTEIDEESTCIAGRTMLAFRKEIERLDWFQACILSQSLSGGTGSGLGSRIMEDIRHKYPRQYIVSVAVAPFLMGDTPLQHYNSMLSLSWLQKYADCIMLFQNDEVSKTVSKMCSSVGPGSTKASEKGPPRTTMQDMNQYIASCLAGVLFPVKEGGHYRPPDIGNLTTNVCPMQSCKFIELFTAPFLSRHVRATSSQHLVRDLSAAVPLYDLTQRQILNISTQVTFRGVGALECGLLPPNFRPRQPIVATLRPKPKILQLFPPVSWNPVAYDFLLSAADAFPGHSIASSVTVSSNRTSVASLLDHILGRVHTMYESKAYLHWYTKYGCSEETFKESFSTAQGVIESYEEAFDKNDD
mmetsp:Transcript_36169/g.58448  ORF Transcript_36169/g.58448 Transcript_36169/m.58448 type:complete len:445 (+) Transcript_36169:97-1431(+)